MTGEARVLFCERFVAHTRHDELVLARLAPVDVVALVEEGAVVYHKRHLKSLVQDLEVAILIDGLNLDFLVKLGQNVLLVAEELNKLVGHDVLDLDLADVERCAVSLPNHVVDHVRVVIRRYDWDLALARQQAHRLVEQLLLDHHAPVVRRTRQLLLQRWLH